MLDELREPFGQRLAVTLGSDVGDEATVRVHYATSPASSAIQWLSPSQTAGKKHPYLFTQCQAIHARSMLPCQDSPAAKAAYSAEITVPKPLVALMRCVLRCVVATASHSNPQSQSIAMLCRCRDDARVQRQH